MTNLHDPREALRPLFRTALQAAFGPEFADEDPILRSSTHADLQANLAMGFARRLKMQPRAVGEAIAAALPRNEVLARVEVAGPGFLNLTLADGWITAAATAMLQDPRFGVPCATRPERVVIDYSAPNVAKEMHVGHLRSTVIGDALARLLSFRGHEVIRQNHVGDWGTPFGMLIEHLLDRGEAEASAELGVGELSSFYKAARRKFDGDPGFADRARNRVVKLQSGDPETLRLWSILVQLSHRYFSEVYRRLDVTLTPDDIKGESFYNSLLAPLCDELEKQGKATINQDALCLFPPGFVNRDKEPLPLMIRKKDGGFGYATTDLAAIRHRIEDLKATRLLYVVGAPQEQHLAMVFAAARELGWLVPPIRAEHVKFGSVLGTDKRMFKTRQGDAVRLVDLIDEAVEAAQREVRENCKEVDDEETIRELSRSVGVGAIKFADLSCDRIKDYVFDLDRMVRFEGRTGGYVQYAHARIQSIFRKTEKELGALVFAQGLSLSSDSSERQAERALMLRLLGFREAVEAVENTLQPHLLCTFLLDTAEAFSTFYQQCPVKNAAPERRAVRLSLCKLTAGVLATGLSLLGIQAPPRM
ncbi:MAG: arginine--tRNA ligase [Myxococcales bacterium]|nr:arginine--tRNA ligase [Polyangiaceae bacterium]MDW8248634.1 arginine--tRNA ligase [Myxococcales bacterium]